MLSKIAQEVHPIKNLLTGVRNDILSRGGVPKLPLKTLPLFNRVIWGLCKGLTTIGARSSQGKSALALQVARDIAEQKIPVLFLSLEMDTASLIERLFCQTKTVDNFDMICGKINKDITIFNKWQEFESEVVNLPLLITNGIGKTFPEVNLLIQTLEPKPKVVIVDYIQATRSTKEERIEINEYIRNFRQLMITNDMTGILCSQLNREVKDNLDKRPALENLKSTGVLEEHSDQVWLLFWNWYYTHKDEDRNKYELILAKNRNGRTGTHDLLFYPEYYQFRETVEVVEQEKLF